MDKIVKSFVTDKFPDFIVAEHEKFKLFIEAYYEWMELQNTTQTTKAKELYKALPNPGAIVANSETLKDIDDTLDGFIEYFRRSVIPIVIDERKTTDRFFIKKIRDVYLSKGTPKSFKLLFRLLYDEDIEIFETKNDILKPSYGQYVQFPISHFRVVDFESNLQFLDFTFARITRVTDSEEEEVGFVLNASSIGIDSDNNSIFRVQLAEEYQINKNDTLVVYDANNSNAFVQVKVLPTVSNVEFTKPGALHAVGDIIEISSKRLNKRFSAIVSNATAGTVEKLYVRDRGFGYGVGDNIRFKGSNGNGGGAFITGLNNSRATSIDGTNLRSGSNNKGFISNKFQSAVVPISNGGTWYSLPSVIVDSQTRDFALPYGQSLKGSGLSVTAVSSSIGALNDVFFGEKPYFINDSDDIQVNTPVYASLQNLDGIEVGERVAFQRFVPAASAFTVDDEYFNFTITIKRKAGELTWRTNTIKVPYAYDFVNFQWLTFNFTVSSVNGLVGIETTFNANRVGFEPGILNTVGDTQTFTAALTTVAGSSYYKLERFHFEALNNLQTEDSDLEFSWVNTSNPSMLSSFDGVSEAGSWVNLTDSSNKPRVALVTGVRAEECVVTLKQIDGQSFIDSELYVSIKSKNFKELIKITPVDVNFNPNTKVEDTNIPFKNVVVQTSKAVLKINTAGSVFTNRNFIDERGFLNSPNGGVLQDNFFYSEFTYIVKTKVPMDKWREKVKTLLHPAGTLMLAQLVLEQQAILPSVKGFSDITQSSFDSFTFDTSLEHYETNPALLQVNADNTRFTSNAFELIDLNTPIGREITADSVYENTFATYNFENGDSWWDFEPLGLISERTTQQSINTLVKEGNVIYNRFDSDNHKNSRIVSLNKPLLSQVQFDGLDMNTQYAAYDSDDYDSEFLDFSNLNGKYQQIRYTSVFDGVRQIKLTSVSRKREIRIQQERDFNLALDGKLIFSEPLLGELKGIEAYERKWNVVNTNRTLNTQGWGIVGYTSLIQNISNNKRVSPQSGMMYSLEKTPLNTTAYDSEMVIFNTYKPLINTVSVVDLSATDSDTVTFDPRSITILRKRT